MIFQDTDISEDDSYIVVYRRRPIIYQGLDIRGYCGRHNVDLTNDTIASEYGGGMYRVMLMGAKKKHWPFQKAVKVIKSCYVTIAGASILSEFQQRTLRAMQPQASQMSQMNEATQRNRELQAALQQQQAAMNAQQQPVTPYGFGNPAEERRYNRFGWNGIDIPGDGPRMLLPEKKEPKKPRKLVRKLELED